MPSQNSPSGRPEIPPDIPPEFVDAYLAGFQRGYGGEVELQADKPVEAPEHAAVEGRDMLDRPRDMSDDPTDDIDPPADEIEPRTDEIEPRPVEIDPPTDQFERLSDEAGERGLDQLERPESEKRGLDKLDRPRDKKNRLDTARPEDMEWLFERDRDAPLGWAFNPADEDSKVDQARSKGTGAGSTSTATEASAGKGEVRTGRSPWVVLIGFLAILVVLMLVAYIGGMAFSTIVNR